MRDTIEIVAAEKQYQDEWLLFEVAGANGCDFPVQGLLLCHSKSRDVIHDAIMASRSPDKCLYIKYAGDPIPPDLTVVL